MQLRNARPQCYDPSEGSIQQASTQTAGVPAKPSQSKQAARQAGNTDEQLDEANLGRLVMKVTSLIGHAVHIKVCVCEMERK